MGLLKHPILFYAACYVCIRGKSRLKHITTINPKILPRNADPGSVRPFCPVSYWLISLLIHGGLFLVPSSLFTRCPALVILWPARHVVRFSETQILYLGHSYCWMVFLPGVGQSRHLHPPDFQDPLHATVYAKRRSEGPACLRLNVI